MSAVEVIMTRHSLLMAGNVGLGRFIIGLNKPGAYGIKENNSVEENIVGCFGELALAKYTGRYWDGAMNNFNAKDVGPYQVRATRYRPPKGRLPLHKPEEGKDRPEDIFILAHTYALPTVILYGWVYGHEGMQEKYWGDFGRNRPCYIVPLEIMRDMGTLPVL